MLPYFPFGNTFDLKMGTSSLDEASLMECDQHYAKEVALKRKLLDEDHSYYFRTTGNTEQAQWEVVDKVLNSLVHSYPQYFTLTKDNNNWHWHNAILNESQSFTFGDDTTLPLKPLDWVGRQVQEDLVILNESANLIGGQLCFPSGWSLDEKLEKHFLDIHAPLPGLLNPMLVIASKLMERIPVGKPLQRNNWGFRVCDQLDLSSRHSAAYKALLEEVSAQVTDSTIGDRVYIRIEHQTLTRLPLSGCILFTIHTYNNLLSDEVKDNARAQALLTFLRTVPADLLAYKLMSPFYDTLIRFLERSNTVN